MFFFEKMVHNICVSNNLDNSWRVLCNQRHTMIPKSSIPNNNICHWFVLEKQIWHILWFFVLDLYIIIYDTLYSSWCLFKKWWIIFVIKNSIEYLCFEIIYSNMCSAHWLLYGNTVNIKWCFVLPSAHICSTECTNASRQAV